MPSSAEIAAALDGAGQVSSDPDVLASYRHDQASPGLLDAGMPAALVRPGSAAEVQRAVRAAADLRIPIVARGAGSGLSGGANAIDGCVVLSLEALSDPPQIDPASMSARVAAGVMNAELKRAAAREGLFYAPDPASSEFSTIGGNVATNAGGLCCIKYGVTRDSLLGLDVVLADGRAVSLGGRTRKDVTGYDLVSLFCGSEGTLGIVTGATVRLLPRPRPAMTLAASFPDLAGTGRAVQAILKEITPSLLEVMDRVTITAVEDMQPMELDRDTAGLLFARADTGGSQGERELERMVAIAENEGAAFVATSDEEAEGRMLLAARRLAYPALERLGATLLDDVAVPVGKLPEMLERIPEIGERHSVLIGTFGHAGEGNLHPTIVYEHRDPQAARRARSAFAEIVDVAVSLGGTPTGEHGVGTLKREMSDAFLGPVASLNRRVKQALDPHGLLNPGKAI